MAAYGFFSVEILVVLAVFVEITASQGYSNGYARNSDVNIDCVQCNMRQLGIMNTCNDPRQRHNCTGCVKTFTKIRIKESGEILGNYKTSEVTSRYCMRSGATNAKEAGCYKHPNNGGYTIQCFCYTDNCNSPGNAPKTMGLGAMFVVAMAAVGLTRRP